MNTCIGLYNQKYFLLFLFYTLLCCIYSGVLLIGRFITCTNNIRICHVTGLDVGLMIGNFLESIIFGIFVLIMLFDQLSAIFDNLPGIDSLQNKIVINKKSKYHSLCDVFGESINYRWFLPVSPTTQLIQLFEHDCNEIEYIPVNHHTTVNRHHNNNGIHKRMDGTPQSQMSSYDLYRATQPRKVFETHLPDTYNNNNSMNTQPTNGTT